MSARFSAGVVIDGFLLEEKLHQGSMSGIWRVRRETEPGGEAMAMKIPLVSDYDDPAAIVGFEVEQMILPTLSGPHFPRFIASGDFSKQPYIVMELLKGESLRNRLADAPLPAEEVARIGARVATALHALHVQHVIHLDLKPSNVMFRDSGEAVLLDFGLSRHDALPDLLQEEFRLPMGTGPYISPEQVRHNRSDPRSDLFSLGVVLYHLVTGERPFGNPTSVRGLRRRLYRDPIPPRALVPRPAAVAPGGDPRLPRGGPRRPPRDGRSGRFPAPAPGADPCSPRGPSAASATARSTVARRRFRSLGEEPRPAAASLAAAPAIILLAVDLSQESEALTDAMRTIVLRVVHAEPGARLACVTVLKTSRIGMDAVAGEGGQSLHLRLLVELKHWSPPARDRPGEDHASCPRGARSGDGDHRIRAGQQRRPDRHRLAGQLDLQALSRKRLLAGRRASRVHRHRRQARVAAEAIAAIAAHAEEPGEPSFRTD